jgi:hypothetical protein
VRTLRKTAQGAAALIWEGRKRGTKRRKGAPARQEDFSPPRLAREERSRTWGTGPPGCRQYSSRPAASGLVKEAAEWKWSSFRHYAFREIGVVEIESEWTARDRKRAVAGGGRRIFSPPRLAREERSRTWGTGPRFRELT